MPTQGLLADLDLLLDLTVVHKGRTVAPLALDISLCCCSSSSSSSVNFRK